MVTLVVGRIGQGGFLVTVVVGHMVVVVVRASMVVTSVVGLLVVTIVVGRVEQGGFLVTVVVGLLVVVRPGMVDSWWSPRL